MVKSDKTCPNQTNSTLTHCAMCYFLSHFVHFASLSPNRLTLFPFVYIVCSCRRRVEQLAARRAHNPEVAGSSPVPAILTCQS